MRLTRTKLAGVAAGLGAGAVVFGMLGSGVGANFVQSAKANAHIEVGTFNCTVSSSNPDVTISNHGHSASVTLPTINSSASGSETALLTVTNTGSIPLAVNWSVSSTGNVFDSGAFSPAPVQQNLKLNAGNARNYKIGVMWSTLSNEDLGRKGTVTYSASCTEPSPSNHPDVTFWTEDGGMAQWNSDGSATLTMPTGPNSAASLIQLHNRGAALPSAEPMFQTSTYNAGSPRWYITFADGQYLFGYPTNSGLGANSWSISGSNSYVDWASVLSHFGSAEVTGVSILMDMDQPNTSAIISNVTYNGSW